MWVSAQAMWVRRTAERVVVGCGSTRQKFFGQRIFNLDSSTARARLGERKEFTYGGGKWAKLGFMMLTAKRVEWAETNAKLKVVPAVGGAVDWDWGHRHFNRSESFLNVPIKRTS